MTLIDNTLDTNKPTDMLSEAGVSIWLDDINRENIKGGKLEGLINSRGVVGVTTNPTIFATALSKGDAYDEQIAQLKASNTDTAEALFQITTTDVADAADLFKDVYTASGGYDGRVSIEVTPGAAYDTAQTIGEAQRLWTTLNRSNVMIKIPATEPGLEAIQTSIANGISVNVTLIFSLQRYQQVIDAYLAGLEEAAEKGLNLANIHSVASFFISRVDTEVNKRIEQLPADVQSSLKNQVALANARLAYRLFEATFDTDRAHALIAKGANLQRPLWASTGAKSEDIPDTYYVTELVGTNVVNTMPEKTLDAVYDHGLITPNTLEAFEEAEGVLALLKTAGIDLNNVTAQLESEGVEKFTASWQELEATVNAKLK